MNPSADIHLHTFDACSGLAAVPATKPLALPQVPLVDNNIPHSSKDPIALSKSLTSTTSLDDNEARPRHAISKSSSFPSLSNHSPHRRKQRRWNSCPTVSAVYQERRLQLRRSICETNVKKLYDDRKERILEIFETQWLLTDDLDDYE